MAMSPRTRFLLTAARQLIADPEHWTQGSNAKRLDGGHVSALDPEAKCFCINGALVRAGDGSASPWPWPWPSYAELCELVPGGDLIAFNDAPGRTHAEVLAFLDGVLAGP
jgi:hypothetical protein